jgi:hypothetical protein
MPCNAHVGMSARKGRLLACGLWPNPVAQTQLTTTNDDLRASECQSSFRRATRAAAASVSAADFRGLRKVRDALGERFKAGAVIYTGANTLPFGDRLAAVPLCGLWAAT